MKEIEPLSKEEIRLIKGGSYALIILGGDPERIKKLLLDAEEYRDGFMQWLKKGQYDFIFLYASVPVIREYLSDAEIAMYGPPAWIEEFMLPGWSKKHITLIKKRDSEVLKRFSDKWIVEHMQDDYWIENAITDKDKLRIMFAGKEDLLRKITSSSFQENNESLFNAL